MSTESLPRRRAYKQHNCKRVSHGVFEGNAVPADHSRHHACFTDDHRHERTAHQRLLQVHPGFFFRVPHVDAGFRAVAPIA